MHFWVAKKNQVVDSICNECRKLGIIDEEMNWAE